ncbi:MAG: hypothetical protein HOL85_11130 [Rhodospirillaceae bacterium]|nr:hypothetical protein [Rhodospirillaceae bacterium]MBT6138143.1 hypothetical protein [Rhodospirillaceae bacterium]
MQRGKRAGLIAVCVVGSLAALYLASNQLAAFGLPIDKSLLQNLLILSVGISIGAIASVMLTREMAGQDGAAKLDVDAGLVDPEVQPQVPDLAATSEVSHPELSKGSADEASLWAQAEFLAAATHELRTPMHAVLGFTQLLEMDVENPLNSRQQGYVQQIRKSGGDLNDIIERVLDLGMLKSGSSRVRIERVPAQDLIEGAIEWAEEQTATAELTVSNLAQERVIFDVSTDRDRVSQVFRSMMSTAIRAVEGNGGLVIGCELTPHDMVRFFVNFTRAGEPVLKANTELTIDELAASGLAGDTGLDLWTIEHLAGVLGARAGREMEVGLSGSLWIDLPIARGV